MELKYRFVLGQKKKTLKSVHAGFSWYAFSMKFLKTLLELYSVPAQPRWLSVGENIGQLCLCQGSTIFSNKQKTGKHFCFTL